MTVGEAIYNARKSKGLTQRKLAHKAGVSLSSYTNWERDLYLPSILPLMRIADVLNVSLDELVGRERRNQ